jgi:hypothetical protein
MSRFEETNYFMLVLLFNPRESALNFLKSEFRGSAVYNVDSFQTRHLPRNADSQITSSIFPNEAWFRDVYGFCI